MFGLHLDFDTDVSTNRNLALLDLHLNERLLEWEFTEELIVLVDRQQSVSVCPSQSPLVGIVYSLRFLDVVEGFCQSHSIVEVVSPHTVHIVSLNGEC